MKKVLALLMCMLIVLSLASCGTKSEGNSESSTQGGTTPGDNTSEPIKISIATMEFGEKPTGREVQDKWIEKCEELMGRPLDISFEYINISDYGEKLKLLMAGGDIPDITTIFGMENADVIKYGTQGVLAELSQYEDIMPNYMKAIKLDSKNEDVAYAPDGNIYAFYHMNVIDRPSGTIDNVGALRYDILEKHNLPMPTTIDELTEVAEALKIEYPDIYPIVQIEEWQNFEFTLAASNHTSTDRYYNGEEFVYGPVEDSYKNVVITLREWYEKGLVSPDYFAHTSTEGLAAVANGTAFIAPSIYPEYPGLWAEEYPEQEWVTFDGLINPEYGTPWNRGKEFDLEQELNTGSSIVVSNKSENIEDIIKFMDLQYHPEVVEILTWGIEGKTFEVDETGKRVLMPEFIGGESSDTLIELALPASGRCRSGIFPTPQNRNMLLDNFNPVCKIYNGNEVVEMQNSVFAMEYEGEVSPVQIAPVINLSTDEEQEYSNIMTAVNTFAKEAKVQFIKGERSFDDWDKYIEEINSMGDIEKALDFYNSKLQ